MSSQEPSKLSGQFHSVKGTAVETIGDMTGSQSWSQSGKEEHVMGEGEYKAPKPRDMRRAFLTGLPLQGFSFGAVTGDKTQQATGNAKNEKGQTQQEINKPA
ncbi:hypothetical protein BDR07DRAFT_1435521 [Suillus spraguei]|nr:hypothetical protein BDR07DRAFT_1435521 [Suillus spraguei]